LSNLFTTAP